MTRANATICDACAEVAAQPSCIEPHQHMQVLRELAKQYPSGGYDTLYRCLKCDTVWAYHTDKWGSICGFKLVSGT